MQLCKLEFATLPNKLSLKFMEYFAKHIWWKLSLINVEHILKIFYKYHFGIKSHNNYKYAL